MEPVSPEVVQAEELRVPLLPGCGQVVEIEVCEGVVEPCGIVGLAEAAEVPDDVETDVQADGSASLDDS